MNSKLKDILNKKAKTLKRKRKVVLLWSKVYRIIIVPLKITFRACSFILAIICAAFPPALVYLLITGVIYFLLEIINNPLKAYNNNFKKNIIPAIYKELNTSITYYPSAIQVSDIKKSGLFKPSYFNNKTHFEGDDYVVGKVNDTEFSINHIKLYNEVVDYLKTAGGCLFSILLFPIFIIRNLFADYAHDDELPLLGIVKKKEVIYDGFFIKTTLNTTFNGRIILIPKAMDKANGKEYLSVFGVKLVRSLDKTIDANYNVYSTNNFLSDQFLIENISNTLQYIFKEEQTPTLTIINNQLHLFIPRQKELFKTSVHNKIKDASFFDTYLRDIKYINDLISKIN